MHLDLEATIQAAAVLLERSPGHSMSYMRLLKLLYLADRRMLDRAGYPITFDRAVSMKNGPVLTETYDLIKGQRVGSDRWSEFISTEGYQSVLIAKPGRSELSRLSIAILQEVQEEVADMDDWALVDHLHAILPEWRPQPNNSSEPISLEDILRALKIEPDDAAEITNQVAAARLRHSAFAI
jgi:uncharacterized phage-associated protein